MKASSFTRHFSAMNCGGSFPHSQGNKVNRPKMKEWIFLSGIFLSFGSGGGIEAKWRNMLTRRKPKTEIGLCTRFP